MFHFFFLQKCFVCYKIEYNQKTKGTGDKKDEEKKNTKGIASFCAVFAVVNSVHRKRGHVYMEVSREQRGHAVLQRHKARDE